MNRREFLLKLSVLSGVGALIPGLKASGNKTLLLITSQPKQDLILLERKGIISGEAKVDFTPVKPASQDITLIQNGALIDPRQSGNTALAEISHSIRNRNKPGKVLIAINQETETYQDVISFQVDGNTVEQIPLSGNYKSIIIPGKIGKTEFHLKDGFLSVQNASCRHALCKKMGAVNRGKIICAPNKLVAHLPGRIKVDSLTF